MKKDEIALSVFILLCIVGVILYATLRGSRPIRVGQAAKGGKAQAKRLVRPPPAKGAKSTMTARPKTGRSAAPRPTSGLFRQPGHPFRAPAPGAKRTIVKSNNSRPEPLVVPEPLSRVIQPGVRGTR